MRSCSSPCRQPWVSRGASEEWQKAPRGPGLSAFCSPFYRPSIFLSHQLVPSHPFQISPAKSHDSLRPAPIPHLNQREMGAAADEEVPVVSTELYHKDFDAFVKVRSSPLRRRYRTRTPFFDGVPSFFVRWAPDSSSPSSPDRPLPVSHRRSVPRMRNTAS